MNITDQLESIMHCISDGFPAFSDYLKAKVLVRKYFAAIAQHSSVLLVGSSQTDIDYVHWVAGDTIEFQKVVVDLHKDEKPSISVGKFDKVIIGSYFSMREISHELALLGNECECLYDYFALNGLVLQHNWYDCIMSECPRKLTPEK